MCVNTKGRVNPGQRIMVDLGQTGGQPGSSILKIKIKYLDSTQRFKGLNVFIQRGVKVIGIWV